MPVAHRLLPRPSLRRPRLLASALAASALAASALALLSACSSVRTEHPLQYAPQHSLYAVANLEPPPEAAQAFDAQLLRPLQPMWDSLLQLLSEDPKTTESPRAQRMLQWLREVDRTAKEQGLKGFGLAPDALFALYEVQLRPVLRIGLHDVPRARAQIEQLLAALGLTPQEHQLSQHASYWAIPLSEQPLPPLPLPAGQEQAQAVQQALQELQPQLLLGLIGQHLVLAIEPGNGPALPAAQLLGLEKPAQNLYQAKTLHEVNQRHGFLPYGVTAWMASERLLPLFGLGGDAQLAQQRRITTLPPSCAADAAALAAQLPELASGITHWDAKRKERRSTVVLEQALRQGLAALPGQLPQAPSGQSAVKPLLEIGLSLRLDKLASWLQQQSSALAAHRSDCLALQPLQQLARQPDLPRALAPLYAIGPNIHGFYAMLTGMDFESMLRQGPSQPQPEIEVAMLFLSDNPQALHSYASLIDKELARQPLQAGAEPRPLPPGTFSAAPHLPAWLGLGQGGVGLAVGPSALPALKQLMQQPAQSLGALFQLRYYGSLLGDGLLRISQQGYEEYLNKAQEQLPERAAEIDASQQWATPIFNSMAEFLRNLHTIESRLGVGPLGLDHYSSLQLQ